ncbi:MAG: SDR family NAD(P)-dependent oxidoreductase [Actinomycetota bacterium]|nr:SDR family NAD(P)-dependent oxidoreductase [Actinomycetota bacterium]
MNPFAGKVAVVTGAGSGIGAALADELSRRGARLALSDVNETAVRGVAAELAGRGTPVHVSALDVADRDAVERYAAEVAADYGVVHQLYNNAGIAGIADTVLDTSYAEFERIINVNLWGVIHGTKAFLPHLIDSGDGHLVNVSSLNGYMAQPGLSSYCTTKFAVRGFTESVRCDLMAAGHPVGVTVVHPGGVKTNIVTAAFDEVQRAGTAGQRDREVLERYNDTLLTMPPARAARIILDGVAAKKPRVLVGNDARAVDILVRLLPGSYPKLVNRFFGKVLPAALTPR